MSGELSQCYNRGCGERFDPSENSDDSCVHHPEAPFFHDAYKGWSCCKKKCTDFTEFLNIKGCTVSKHNPVKPLEPEKPKGDTDVDEVIQYKSPQPIKPSELTRPDFESRLENLKSSLSPSLQDELAKRGADTNAVHDDSKYQDGIKIGTSCKNGGCRHTYEGCASNDSFCEHHPGVPIFHEGLKYWSCCQKKTTDFNSFLEQAGCTSGKHVWEKKDETASKALQCRFDWMQTGSMVCMNIYAKKYDPDRCCVEANPIRLKPYIFFPDQQAAFTLDLELKGIIDVEQSSVLYTPTKVEIKMKKAEPMSWPRLDIPRPVKQTKKVEVVEENMPKVDAIDLSDL